MGTFIPKPYVMLYGKDKDGNVVPSYNVNVLVAGKPVFVEDIVLVYNEQFANDDNFMALDEQFIGSPGGNGLRISEIFLEDF